MTPQVKATPAPPVEDPPETITDFGKRRVVVLTYNPIEDEVEVDNAGCSPLETRGIIADVFTRMFPQAVES